MRFTLPTLEHTQGLARCFAQCGAATNAWPVLLMQGQLGAGKTTFVRALVLALPGGVQAEVSSPSFTLLHLYPTTPEMGHFDLYRNEGLGFGPDLEEILLDPHHFCVVEWAQYLPQTSWPDEYIFLTWMVEGDLRQLEAVPHGQSALALMNCVHKEWVQKT